MSYRLSFFSLLVVADLASSGALGQSASVTTGYGAAAQTPDWLSTADTAALVDRLPDPPLPGSSADQADLKTETDIQETRSPERSNQAVIDAGNAAELIMKDVDPRLTPANDPDFYQFLKRLQNQAAAVDAYAKDRWKRPRPFVAHPDVIHPLFTADGFSYPSGHSTVAMCDAVILAQIFPDKATQIEQDAERIAESRVVAGVHYETDIQQGEALGKLVARELMTKPAFLDALYAAKGEIRH